MKLQFNGGGGDIEVTPSSDVPQCVIAEKRTRGVPFHVSFCASDLRALITTLPLWFRIQGI